MIFERVQMSNDEVLDESSNLKKFYSHLPYKSSQCGSINLQMLNVLWFD